MILRCGNQPALFLGLVVAASSFAPAPPPPEQPTSPDLSGLLEARHRAAVKQFEEIWVYYKQARTEAFIVYVWSHFILESEFDLSDKKADRVAAIEAHLDRMRKLETLVKKVRKLGFGQSIEVGATEYYRFEAEYWLAHAQAESHPPPPPVPLPLPLQR